MKNKNGVNNKILFTGSIKTTEKCIHCFRYYVYDILGANIKLNNSRVFKITHATLITGIGHTSDFLLNFNAVL